MLHSRAAGRGNSAQHPVPPCMPLTNEKREDGGHLTCSAYFAALFVCRLCGTKPSHARAMPEGLLRPLSPSVYPILLSSAMSSGPSITSLSFATTRLSTPAVLVRTVMSTSRVAAASAASALCTAAALSGAGSRRLETCTRSGATPAAMATAKRSCTGSFHVKHRMQEIQRAMQPEPDSRAAS